MVSVVVFRFIVLICVVGWWCLIVSVIVLLLVLRLMICGVLFRGVSSFSV